MSSEAKLPSAGYSDLERYLHVCHVNGVEPDEAKVRAIIGAEQDALQAKLDRVRARAVEWSRQRCLAGYRLHDGNDSDSECLHCAGYSVLGLLERGEGEA